MNEFCLEDRRNVVEFYRAPSVFARKVWELVHENHYDGNKTKLKNKEHLLWTTYYLKEWPNYKVMIKSTKKQRKIHLQKNSTWVGRFVHWCSCKVGIGSDFLGKESCGWHGAKRKHLCGLPSHQTPTNLNFRSRKAIKEENEQSFVLMKYQWTCLAMGDRNYITHGWHCTHKWHMSDWWKHLFNYFPQIIKVQTQWRRERAVADSTCVAEALEKTLYSEDCTAPFEK